MPHFTVEYSANLEGHVDFEGLCRTVHRAILKTDLFEVGAVRVRTIRSDHYAVADLVPENAFVDMSFRIGQGRTSGDKRAAGEVIFAAAAEALAELLDAPHFALSLEIREIDPDLSWKRNIIHPRIREKAK